MSWDLTRQLLEPKLMTTTSTNPTKAAKVVAPRSVPELDAGLRRPN